MQVIVCAMAKNEHLYINDWVKHYSKLGFDKIYLFDNDDNDKAFIKDYIDKSLLDKVVVVNVRGQKRKNLQHEIYTYFYLTHNFDWVLFCDIDEFLFGVENIHSFLSQEKFNNVKQIRIKWKLFGDDELITRDTSIPVYDCFKKEITNCLDKALDKPFPLHNQAKMIVRGKLKNVIINSAHFASYRNGKIIPSVLPSGSICNSAITLKEDYSNETIYLNHYMTKSLDEFLNQKFERNDAVFNKNLTIDYYWRINKKTEEKLKYIERKLNYGTQN